MIRVRPATPEDAAAWLRMRDALWPQHEAGWHAGEVAQFFAGNLRMPLEVLLAFDEAGAAVGFAELSIRSYAEHRETDRVAYLEGCTKFGSDALLENELSAVAHRALGFEETVRLRCFKKALGSHEGGDTRLFQEP